MGRKSNWRSGETTAIRIPKALESQVMAYAKALDEGSNATSLEGERASQSSSSDIHVQCRTSFLYEKSSSRYAHLLEAIADNLDELKGFVQNPVPPFCVGHKVVIQLSFPDDYRIVEVLEMNTIRVGLVQFLCLHPDTGDRIRWFWHPGSDTVPLKEGETLESAIRRSIVQKSLESLIKTDFRMDAFGLDFLKFGEVASVVHVVESQCHAAQEQSA